MSLPAAIPSGWRRVLAAHGFHSLGDGSYGRSGLRMHIARGWVVFEHRVWREADPPAQGTCQRALWKSVGGDAGGGWHYEASIPRSILSENEEADPFECCLDWVAATAAGRLPDGWCPPPQAESWIPEGGLSVQAGALARQGRLVLDAEKLQVEFPLAVEVAPAISAARRQWLRAVIDDAQRRWRLVHIDYRMSGGHMSCLASIDLSGVPPSVAQPLFAIGLDALRWVVSALIWPVGCLADPGAECPLWEVSPDTLFPTVLETGGVR